MRLVTPPSIELIATPASTILTAESPSFHASAYIATHAPIPPIKPNNGRLAAFPGNTASLS